MYDFYEYSAFNVTDLLYEYLYGWFVSLNMAISPESLKDHQTLCNPLPILPSIANNGLTIMASAFHST